MKNIINVTSNAWKKMNSIILKSNNNFGLLFGVTSGGCNGFNFNLNLMDKNDYESIMKLKPNILTNDNVTLFIEPVSEIYIIGTTIDYVNEDYKKGIFENKFTYNVDKKLATSCGCGISFTPRNL
jgi:iron-sulfur cluster assembly accessory protein